MSRLDGKVALITGAGSGIGRATAVLMAERGADVAIVDLDEAGAEETARAVRAHGRRAGAFPADVAEVAAVRGAVAAAEDALGGIDILVNNAGIPSERRPLEDVTEAIFERAFGVHVKGTLFTTQAVVPGMKARGGGKIVNLSSVQAMAPYPNGAVYNGAKGAVLAMAKGWAKEFAPWHICVNVIAPGAVTTPMTVRNDPDEVRAEKARGIPFKRYGTPEEMACTIAFLCSSEADYITGQVISPNGGLVIVGI